MVAETPRFAFRPGRGAVRALAGAGFLFLAFAACALAQPAAGPDLVQNGTFYMITKGTPDYWKAIGDPKKDVAAAVALARDDDGGPCGQLVCTRCEPRDGSSRAMLCQTGEIKLVAGRTYRFSCRMRGDKDLKVGLAFQETQGALPVGLDQHVSVGKSWQDFKFTFHAQRDAGATGQLQISITEPGLLWVSDVRIFEVRGK